MSRFSLYRFFFTTAAVAAPVQARAADENMEIHELWTPELTTKPLTVSESTSGRCE